MSKVKPRIFKDDFRFDSIAGIYSDLSFESLNSNFKSRLELDYKWDYLADPIITPTIIHEWDFLDILTSQLVTKNAPIVLSIGGGGNSRTHVYLSQRTNSLIVLNPGWWDLNTYPTNFNNIDIIKVRGIAENLPFRDFSISAVEIPSTLDHVVEPSKVVSEAFRVLSDHGKIGITLGNQQSWYRKLFEFLNLHFQDNHTHAHSFHFHPKDIEQLLVSAGFRNVKTVGTAFLKLPKRLERKMGSPFLLAIHRWISNKLMRGLFSRYSGGMFIVVGEKPSS